MRTLFLTIALVIPATALAAPAASPRAMAVHQKLIALDTHLDTPANLERTWWDIADAHDPTKDFAQVDLPRMAAGGLDGGFFAIYTPQGARTPEATRAARDGALYRAALIREMVAKHRDRMELAFTADDAARIAAKGKVIVYQSIENAYPLSGDPSLITAFYKLGVRMTGIAHFRNNDFGDSATDPAGPEWKGLSPAGKQLVVDANRLGIVLDASHSSDLVFDQLLALSKSPIILSHSGCRSIFDHPRNIDDARLKALAAKGGVIQMNAYSGYLAAVPPNPARDAEMKAFDAKMGDETIPRTAAETAALVQERDAILARYPGSKPPFDAFMAHMLHALKLVGPDHVGIGADWDGGGGLPGFEDVSRLPMVTEALLKAGYSEADIAKVWSGNLLRVLRAAEVEAAREKAG